MRRARRGMTLMELVIALTVLALVATMGGAAFATLIDRQATIRTASADVERAAALRETIRQWILQGEPFVASGGVPSMAPSSRTWLTTGTDFRKRSGMSLVKKPLLSELPMTFR